MTGKEELHLRHLAGRYADYAHSEAMAQRREKWRLHNRLEEKTFPFHVEDNGTYLHELIPPLECEEPDCRHLEARLLHALISYETINDDRIIPDLFVVDWSTEMSSYCEELQLTYADAQSGQTRGYETNKPIADIDQDFHKLKKRSLTLHRDRTHSHLELARKIFDGLLPVVVGRPGSSYSGGFLNRAVHLMGMQELFLQMAMNPEAVHRLFAFLVEDSLALGQWEEEQGLLILNNDGNQGYCSGSCQFSDEIPGREITSGEKILSTDRYGYLEAQEATGISPDMFDEFCMPHFEKLAAKFKLMKFGCCEAVHALMPHLQRLPGLRKVSVSPWCDLEVLAAECNRNVIWSRKPTPLKLCDVVFDPDDFRNHLRETIEIGKEHFVEFVFRDTNRLTGDMKQRVEEACGIVREVTGHPEGKRPGCQ